MRRPARDAVALAGCAMLLVAGGSARAAEPHGSLEIASWWTSSSETPALDVLIDRFKQADPGVSVDNTAVKGGAGSNVQVVLARRLREGDPPDVWQTFLGTSLRSYAQNGHVVDLGSVFDRTGLGAAIPAPVLAAATWNGRPWGVPTGAHRGNMLWFDPALLRRSGVALPSSDTDAATFATDLATLKSHGVTPLCLGGKDRFTTTELFENILLSIIGTRGWSEIVADRFDWTGKDVREALAQLAGILDDADPDAASLTWDEAAKRLAGS